MHCDLETYAAIFVVRHVGGCSSVFELVVLCSGSFETSYLGVCCKRSMGWWKWDEGKVYVVTILDAGQVK